MVYQDMSANSFFTTPTIRKQQLLRIFPVQASGNGIRNKNVADSWTRSREFQISFVKRFSRGFNMNVGYTAMSLREADFYFYEWDKKPAERISNDGRPQRFVGSGIFELPFGKGKPLFANVRRPVNYVIGGWQLSATYEWQPGPLLDFGSNVFYYGNLADITKVSRTYNTWFNTANFERAAAKGPNDFHRRQFPTRINDLRRDMTNQCNAALAKNLQFTERWKLQLRMDALNLQNRSQMDAPSRDPYSTNFGRVTSQTAATNRWIQIQARITF